MINDALILFSAICFALLLATLLWPSRRRSPPPRPTVPANRWNDDPDIRLRDFQMAEWRAGRRSAPPSPKVCSKAREAEDNLVRQGIDPHGTPSCTTSVR